MTLLKTILVVDDDPSISELLQINLEREGYKVVTAVNGQQALEEIAVQTPDIILLDQIMPGISGFEVARKLKEDAATAMIPIVMLTAKDGYDDMSKGWQSGVDLYLVKPIDLQELHNIIQSVFQL